MKEVGVAYRRKDKLKRPYIMATINGRRFFLFPNPKKTASHHPDWLVVSDERQTRLGGN